MARRWHSQQHHVPGSAVERTFSSSTEPEFVLQFNQGARDTPCHTHTHMRVHTLFHAFSECHHSSLCAHSDPFWLKSTQGPSVWDAGAPLHLSSSSRLRRSADGILTHLSAFGSGSLAACVFVGFSLLSPSPLPAPPPHPPRPSISLLSAHRASLCLPLPLPVTCSLLASSSFSSSLRPPLLHTHSRPRPSFRLRDRSGRPDGQSAVSENAAALELVSLAAATTPRSVAATGSGF